MNDQDQAYYRLIISGTLTTRSPLHIGTGELESKGDSACDDEQGSINTLLVDQDGNPYIPASTLRGYLRNRLQQHEPELDTVIKTLFGEARDTADDGETGNMGALRVYDARIKLQVENNNDKNSNSENKNNSWKAEISRTSIDPVTATAKQHHLTTHQIVNTSTVFEVRLELDNIKAEPVRYLLAALDSLKTEHSAIGKGKSTGQGRIDWKCSEIKGLSCSSFAKWVADDTTDWDQYFNPVNLEPALLKQAAWQSETIRLCAQSPLLINDPQLVAQRRKEAEADEQGDKHTEDLVFMRRGDQAVIPGSTLKGWLRGHCRRILLTITDDPHQTDTVKSVEALLRQLFGGTKEGTGFLQFTDASVAIDPERIHQQMFNAVDRFTGGVKDSALYRVESIYPEEPFSGTVLWRNNKSGVDGNTPLSDAMRLLLLFALRDAMEGDLVLGWGKSKGYGRLKLVSDNVTDWKAIKARLFADDHAITAAFETLKNELRRKESNHG